MQRTFRLLLTTVLLALAVTALVVPDRMLSPGRPIVAHAHLATRCFACHSAFGGASAEKCQACHKVAEIGLLTTTGVPIASEQKAIPFHQQLIAAACVDCHSDHRGVQAFRPISRFSHGLLQPSLRDQCAGCHTPPGDALHQKLDTACGQCHTQQGWLPATFAHETYFRFDRHHPADCATCHRSNNYATYTCYGCHAHSRSSIRGEHLEEGIRDYENCVKCHRSGDEHEAERLWRSQQFGAEGQGGVGSDRGTEGGHFEREYDDD